MLHKYTDTIPNDAYLLQVVEVEYFVIELLFLALGQIISEHETADVIVHDPFGRVSHDVGEESVHLLLELTLNTSLQSRQKGKLRSINS